MSKILSTEEACAAATLRHHQGTKIAFATGCFDILHRGHIELLERAAGYGELFVGLNSDSAIRQLKGDTRPINKFQDRAFVIAALGCVSAVFEIDSITVAGAILLVRPSFWIKGGGYTLDTLNKIEVEAAHKIGAEIVLVPQVEGYSTTNILSKI